jgi:hypothetical protein
LRPNLQKRSREQQNSQDARRGLSAN